MKSIQNFLVIFLILISYPHSSKEKNINFSKTEFKNIKKMEKSKKNIALVLSGGASRGLAHIGVIEELEKQGFNITSVAGNSMGAFIAGMYAMGYLEGYKKWILTLDKADVFNLIDFTISTQGLIKGDKVFNKMKELFPDKNIEDLEIPFAAVATDITNMKEVVFTKGSVYNALRASVAIPTVFTPAKNGDITMVDGGVVNPIPLNRVKRTDGDILVASYVNAQIPYDKPIIIEDKDEDTIYTKKIKEFLQKLNNKLPTSNKEHLNYISLLNRSTSMLTHTISTMMIEKYNPEILINVSAQAGSTFDFFKAEELIEAGRLSAIKSIGKYNDEECEK